MTDKRKPVVIVTGASKGLGLAITKILLQDFNAEVIALSRTLSPELNQLSCSSLLWMQCDVGNEASLRDAITFAVSEKGYETIDGLILNAAIMEPVARIDSDVPVNAWRSHFESSLGGKVVFVSSGAAIKGNPGWAAYNASKAAMNSLCRTLAEEEPNIVTIALRPGMVDTDMQTKLRAMGPTLMGEIAYSGFVRAYEEGTLVKPEDAGYVAAALSLKASKELTGQFVTWNSEECKAYRRE